MTELVQRETTPALPTAAEFQESIDRAGQIATILARIIRDKQLSVAIGAGEHIRIEAWRTLAEASGYAVSTGERDWDGPGRKAWARLIRKADGMIISTADEECGTDDKDKEWWDKTGFVQSGMAQTRAASRVCRNVLDWVVVLAGYKTTPVEEMPTEPRTQAQRGTPSSSSYPQGPVCSEHGIRFFRTPKMRSYAHPRGEGEPWCNMPTDSQIDPPTPSPSRGADPDSDALDARFQRFWQWVAQAGSDPVGVQNALGTGLTAWLQAHGGPTEEGFAAALAACEEAWS